MAKEGYVQYNLKLRKNMMSAVRKKAEEKDLPLSQWIRNAILKELKRS